MKHWKNITLAIPGCDLRSILDDLLDLEILSVTIKDFKDIQSSNWFHYHDLPLKFSGDTHSISLLLDAKVNSGEIVEKIKDKLKLCELRILDETICQDQDWVLKSQSNFQGTQISKTLRISPPWSTIEDPRIKNVIIKPGTGFGTGTHPTTKLCLDWIEENSIENKSLIDYGSGSGILSIVSKLNGASNIVGVDIDQKAIDNSIHNCQLNGIHIPFVNVSKKNIQEKFDIVIANILSKTLIQLSDEFKNLAKEKLILCGVLDKQVSNVVDAYSKWIVLEKWNSLKGWNLLEGTL